MPSTQEVLSAQTQGLMAQPARKVGHVDADGMGQLTAAAKELDVHTHTERHMSMRGVSCVYMVVSHLGIVQQRSALNRILANRRQFVIHVRAFGEMETGGSAVRLAFGPGSRPCSRP